MPSRVLVVDDDEVSRNLIASHLTRMGVAVVDLAEDGHEAWAKIQNEQTYELIVLDWKLPKLSGLALFNRIRRRTEYRTTPLLVVSGFLEKHDFRLLQEFPCTALMEKPFTMVLFQNRVEELLKETVWYTQNVALMDTVLSAIKSDERKAEQLVLQVLRKAPNPVPLALIAARRLVRSRKIKAAESILRGVLDLDDACVMAMSELGKVLHLSGRHKEALDVLQQASRLSPQNLSRLCLIGEVELNLKDPESARAHFQKALELDPHDVKAKAGITVAGNMIEMDELVKAPDAGQVPHAFASLLNTMGIAYVRNGQYSRGIEQYRAALAFLHVRNDSARVAFNLGLGYLRWGRPNEALPWFQKSEQLAPRGFGKSAAYVRQLLTAGASDAESGGREGPKFGRADGKADKARGTGNTADGEGTAKAPAGGQVIPFPVPGAASGEDEMLEEIVGPGAAARQAPDGDAEPAGNDEFLDGDEMVAL
jgi:CheY-like chemotaxis protein/Flp pilus assembly protein TadD